MKGMFTDECRSIQLSKGTLRYRDYGVGEPLLFVHGFLVDGMLWRKVVPGLARRFRCIVPDLPLGSHQQAMNRDADLTPKGIADLIAEFVSALGLDRVTLVGNDTGGALCQIVATEHPDKVERLILTNCDCFDRFPPPEFVPLLWGARIPGFLFVLAQEMRFDIIRRSPLAYGWLTKRPIDGRVLDAWLRPMIANAAIRRDIAKVLKGVSPKVTKEAARKLARFDRPALIAWASEDRFFPIEYARKLADVLPHARLESIADSLAFVPEDQPDKLAELIADFLTETAPPVQKPMIVGRVTV